MRYGPTEPFWIVVDPGPESTLEDIMFPASLKDLELQFKGGLSIDQNPTLLTEKWEAEIEAHGRLVAMQAAKAIADSCAGEKLGRATQIQLLDERGKIVFGGELRRVERGSIYRVRRGASKGRTPARPDLPIKEQSTQLSDAVQSSQSASRR